LCAGFGVKKKRKLKWGRGSVMAKKSGKKTDESRRVKITLVKSTIGFNRDQEKVVTGMGLRRIGHTVELADTPATRGMILKVRHLVTVE
jgi:large subunit ribosomal protein L30